MNIVELEDLAGLPLGRVYRFTAEGRDFAVACGIDGGLSLVELRPLAAEPPPPPPGKWKEISPAWQGGEGQKLYRYAAQPLARSIQVSVDWTPREIPAVGFEPLWFVGMGGPLGGALHNLLLLYLTIRRGLTFRTGVATKTKSLARADFEAQVGTTYRIKAQIFADGHAGLFFHDGGAAIDLTAPKPADGEPGPWPFDLYLQLDKSDKNDYDNLAVEVLE